MNFLFIPLLVAHEAEITSAIGFEKLRSTKEGEIQAAATSIDEKSSELADTKQDLEDTTEALDADTKFLIESPSSISYPPLSNILSNTRSKTSYNFHRIG